MHGLTMHAYICLGISISIYLSLVANNTHALCAQRQVPLIMCAHSIDLVLINHSTQIKKLYFNSHNPNLKHITPNMA